MFSMAIPALFCLRVTSHFGLTIFAPLVFVAAAHVPMKYLHSVTVHLSAAVVLGVKISSQDETIVLAKSALAA